jgi:hypothetical protein
MRITAGQDPPLRTSTDTITGRKIAASAVIMHGDPALMHKMLDEFVREP